MKLYNLFEQVILEEIQKHKLLTEGVSEDAITSAINGKYNVRIAYQGAKDVSPTNRYIQIYNLGNTKSGKRAVRAFQLSGDKKSSNGEWRIFLLDNISNLEPTNMKWVHPVSDFDPSIPSYNQLGDKSFMSVSDRVDPDSFTRQRSDVSQKPSSVARTVVPPKEEPINHKPSQAPKHEPVVKTATSVPPKVAKPQQITPPRVARPEPISRNINNRTTNPDEKEFEDNKELNNR